MLNERIIFTLTRGDVYADNKVVAGSVITQFQKRLNEIDISNYFVILLTNDATIPEAYLQAQSTISLDPVPITIILYEETITEKCEICGHWSPVDTPSKVAAYLKTHQVFIQK